MSGQAPQRVRRIASPSTKQGPMKATLPFGLVSQGSPTRPPSGRKNSPTSSPTPQRTDIHRAKSRRSPDARASPERNSPNSPCFKVERPKPIRMTPGSSSIKRAGSYDTIAGPYLTGQWPKSDLNLLQTINPLQPAGPVVYTTDKATQTPEAWDEVIPDRTRRSHSLQSAQVQAHKRSASVGGNGETLKEVSERKIIKQRLAKTKEGRASVTSIQRLSPVQGNHVIGTQFSTSLIQSKAVAIPVPYIPNKPAVRIRGSVEGLNLEIQRALKSSGCDEDSITVRVSETQEPIPDGHQAPVSELISRSRTCSVDTQTPSGFLEELRFTEEPAGSSSSSSSNSQSSSRSQSESPSIPIIPGTLDSSPLPSINSASLSPDTKEENELLRITKEEGDGGETPDSKPVPSPKPIINPGFVREPPDGCEKVKIIDEARGPLRTKESFLYCPIKKSMPDCPIPSSMSAFFPLNLRSYLAPDITLKPPPTNAPTPLMSPAGIEAQQLSHV